VGSSPDNDGTGRHRQTARVRQVRQKGVTRVNQWLNPLKRGTSSNLVDVGWATVCVDLIAGKTTPKSICADPADRNMVNVGTIPGPSLPSCSQREDGQVHRRLMTP
jgi:hypothetical protein